MAAQRALRLSSSLIASSRNAARHSAAQVAVVRAPRAARQKGQPCRDSAAPDSPTEVVASALTAASTKARSSGGSVAGSILVVSPASPSGALASAADRPAETAVGWA